jgi:putative FmdB family regulatory protein
MPIFEYSCKACGRKFETLVLRGETPACPSCESTDLEKLFSLPAIKSEATHLAMRAAKKRDSIQARANVEEQRLYEQAHEASEGI